MCAVHTVSRRKAVKVVFGTTEAGVPTAQQQAGVAQCWRCTCLCFPVRSVRFLYWRPGCAYATHMRPARPCRQIKRRKPPSASGGSGMGGGLPLSPGRGRPIRYPAVCGAPEPKASHASGKQPGVCLWIWRSFRSTARRGGGAI